MRRSHRPTARAAVAAMAILLGALGAGCADDDAGGAGGTQVDIADSEFVDETGKDELDIDVPDNLFEPPYVRVSPGTKVTWTNTGRNDHNVVPVEKDSFEGVVTAEFGPGQVHSATFEGPGDYPYYCSIHGTKRLNGQAGVIRVVDGSSSDDGA